jgi:hypothetical protein
MSWKRDRDSLIAQTMAFVQSVTGRMEDAGRANVDAPPAGAELALLETPEDKLAQKAKRPVLEPVRAAAPPPSAAGAPAPLPPPVPAASITRSNVQGEMANEIRARIASFRAHQERFNREREEYFSQTLTRLRAALKDAPPPRPPK